MTTDYDIACAAEFAALESRVDRYFVELNTECPYGLPYMASFHQAIFGPLTDRAMELFLAAGYRRNGNCLYNMRCAKCQACIPIRLKTKIFKPNRNQRRAARKNHDLTIRLTSVDMEQDNMVLCDRFLKARYPQEHNTAQGYYGGFFCNTIVDSVRIEFYLKDKLVAGSIVDLGGNWMNAVYFYFDPDESSRSLGTFNILTLVDICLDYGIDYLYLGYYIKGVAAMCYKEHFRPHELFLDSRWVECN